MTYKWQLSPENTQVFTQGELVGLNPAWSMYSYLVQEFGHLFPRRVESASNDLVRFKLGKAGISFASQTLTKIRRH